MASSNPEVKKYAELSPCGHYRYSLSRDWSGDPNPENARRLGFVMLNPSTADDREDDPTIRRCVGFAKLFGFNAIEVLNLYPYRVTDPAQLWKRTDRELCGPPAEDEWCADWAASVFRNTWSGCIVAWGVLKTQRAIDRANVVLGVLKETGIPIECLGWSKDRFPLHPLYLPRDTKRVVYAPLGGFPK